MGLSPPSDTAIRYLFSGSGCTCLTQSPTDENPLSMPCHAHSAQTEVGACNVSGDLAIGDDHEDSRDHVMKRCKNAEAPCCDRWDEPRTRLFPRAESDRLLETSVMQAALTVKGTRHKAAVMSSSSGYLHISSGMQPRMRGVDAGENTTFKVSECGALESTAYSFGFLTWKHTIHLRDALPRVFGKAESINNTEDMAHPSGGVLMHFEEAELKSGLDDGGACAEYRAATMACGQHVVQHRSEAALYTDGSTASYWSYTF
ncbi:hypothetical protein MRX96_028224 [Rhipicephalus microplus]